MYNHPPVKHPEGKKVIYSKDSINTGKLTKDN